MGYGNCVFYLYNESLPDDGQWGNGNCDVDQLSYLCEVPPTIDGKRTVLKHLRRE